MNKDIKQAIDNIQVPMEKLDDAIEKGLKITELQAKPKKRRAVTFILSSVVTISIIIGLGFVSPTMASVLANVPLLNTIFETTDDPGLKVALNDTNANVLNKTISSNGVSLTIQDIVYDGTRLAFSFVQEKKEEIYPLHIEVNGEIINFSENLRSTQLENGDHMGLIQVYPKEPLPDDFELLVKIHQIGDTKGDWQFNAHITKVKTNSKKIAVGQTGVIDGIQYEVKKLELADTGVSLHLLFHTEMDELFNLERVIQLHVLDENGRTLPIVDEHGSGDEKGMRYEYLFEPIDADVESLTISPFFMPHAIDRKAVIATLHEDQLPLTMSQGKMGDLIVTKLEKQNDQYTMYFESTSAFIFGAHFEQNLLAVEDELGNNLVVTYPKAIANNQYKLVFNKPDEGSIKLKTIELPIMKKDKEAQITVDLSQTE
ncbi:DUF4179 domain-containing protein [Lysinibacillus fusiformis]